MTTKEQPSNSAARTYLKWFLLLFFPLCLAVLIFKRTDYFPWVGACDASGYDSEHYLAYCHTTRFGDYEHYAFWHNTEKDLLQNLSDARVLFLGNSRTQYAFSTEAVRDFFETESLPYYVFGFGLGGKSGIPRDLIKKYDLKPDVLVINADPFFSSEIDETLALAKINSDATVWEHKAKIQLQKIQQYVCDPENFAPLLSNILCNGEAETLFRSRENGFWLTDYYRPDKLIPVAYDNSFMQSMETRLQLLEAFIEDAGVPRECVILTVTPQSTTPLKFAETLATQSGLNAYFPAVDELFTIDDSHLNEPSAERWSAAFLGIAQENIAQCLGLSN